MVVPIFNHSTGSYWSTWGCWSPRQHWYRCKCSKSSGVHDYSYSVVFSSTTFFYSGIKFFQIGLAEVSCLNVASTEVNCMAILQQFYFFSIALHTHRERRAPGEMMEKTVSQDLSDPLASLASLESLEPRESGYAPYLSAKCLVCTCRQGTATQLT